MPNAVVHDVAESLPGALVLDASFVVKVLNRRDPEHSRARALYGRLVSHGTICAYVEHLHNLEFWFAWQSAVRELDHVGLGRLASEIRESVPGQLELPVEEPEPRTVVERRDRVLQLGDELLDLYLSFLSTTKVRVTQRLMASARDITITSGLKPMDAVVAAAAFAIGADAADQPSVATMDRDFRRVAGLHVWGVRTTR